MSREAFKASLLAAIEPQAVEVDGVKTIGLGTFVRTSIDRLKTLVDTEEERDAYVADIMAVADLFVAPRFPLAWRIVRGSLQAILDEAIDQLAEL